MKANSCDARIEIETGLLEQTLKIDVNEQKQLRANDKLLFETEKHLMRKAIKEAHPKWFERPGFVLTMGVVVGALSTWGMFELGAKVVQRD